MIRMKRTLIAVVILTLLIAGLMRRGSDHVLVDRDVWMRYQRAQAMRRKINKRAEGQMQTREAAMTTDERVSRRARAALIASDIKAKYKGKFE